MENPSSLSKFVDLSEGEITTVSETDIQVTVWHDPH